MLRKLKLWYYDKYLFFHGAELYDIFDHDKDSCYWELYWRDGIVLLCQSERHSREFALEMSYHFIQKWKSYLDYPHLESVKVSAYERTKNGQKII